MYIPKYFRLEECVSKKVFDRFGQRAWEFFDDRALITQDALRERYGKIIINDWLWGGHFDSRGFRAPDDTDGAEFSAHKRGQAFDSIFQDVTAEEVRQDILKNPNLFPYINAIEAGISWFHQDCRNCKRIKVFHP